MGLPRLHEIGSAERGLTCFLVLNDQLFQEAIYQYPEPLTLPGNTQAFHRLLRTPIGVNAITSKLAPPTVLLINHGLTLLIRRRIGYVNFANNDRCPDGAINPNVYS